MRLMDGTWRSSEMLYVRLVLPHDLAHASVRALAQTRALQMVDLNAELTAFHRPMVEQLNLLAGMERDIAWLQQQIEAAGIPLPSSQEEEEMIARQTAQEELLWEREMTRILETLPHEIDEQKQRIIQLNLHYEEIKRTHRSMKELLVVLQHADELFGSRFGGLSHASSIDDIELAEVQVDERADSPLLEAAQPVSPPKLVRRVSPSSRMVGHISGVLKVTQRLAFERMVFRLSRGNTYARFVNLPSVANQPDRVAFAVYFSSSTIREKLERIVASLDAELFEVELDASNRERERHRIAQELYQHAEVMQRSLDMRLGCLRDARGRLAKWRRMIREERVTRDVMNMCSRDMSQASIIGEAWCLKQRFSEVQYQLEQTARRLRSNVSPIATMLPFPDQTIPTHFKTNKFTSSFQGIVDAYGMARYQEVNPGVVTIMTFPFLFAVMFGDVGHGVFLTLFALFMILKEKSLGSRPLNEIFERAFTGRYVLLLMGLFSIYIGFLYNEVFSIGFSFFGRSGWVANEQGVINSGPSSVYPFGIDPAWRESSNELLFLNSFKMKISIVLGVTQMTVGIIFSVFNHIHFEDYLDIWMGFIPRILFMLSTFGYMVLLILTKWLTAFESTHDAPSLIQSMIHMFLGGPNNNAVALYSHQTAVETFLYTMALLCIPVMLAGKPYFLWKRHVDSRRGFQRLVPSDSPSSRHDQRPPSFDSPTSVRHDAFSLPRQDDPDSSDNSPSHEHDEEFNLAEIVTHELIHTLEFVLGCVSNTASYLRLWALSLAHSQLSTVFWKYFIGIPMTINSFALVIGFSAWLAATIGVLMIMETLSAFLHALRLHWVEFFNKFYNGTGIPYQPFSFEARDIAEP